MYFFYFGVILETYEMSKWLLIQSVGSFCDVTGMKDTNKFHIPSVVRSRIPKFQYFNKLSTSCVYYFIRPLKLTFMRECW